MSNSMALGGAEQQHQHQHQQHQHQQQGAYMQASYQPGMAAADMAANKGQPTPVGALAHSGNGLDKGDGGKEGQQHGSWPSGMEQHTYYKPTAQGHGSHPGNYYGAHMAPPHHPYMWGAQQMMPPYGSAPHSHYGYGAMYAPQHPAMNTPHPSSTYTYNSNAQTPGKDGMMVPAAAPQAAQTPSVVPVSSVQEQGTTDGSSEDDDLRRGKRGYDTLSSGEAGVQMANPANGSTPTPYPYGSEMWAMGAPVQRGQVNPALSGDVAPMPYQDEREIKRQRRKQSNRESARRSRLRKQAECEDLGLKVSSLNSENMQMKKQLAELQERCSLLTRENSRLRDQALAAGVSVDASPMILPASVPEEKVVLTNVRDHHALEPAAGSEVDEEKSKDAEQQTEASRLAEVSQKEDDLTKPTSDLPEEKA